jgi:alpha-ketoglutarate-dependent 2,4-dichlorophenoxyacetate dioxygenase
LKVNNSGFGVEITGLDFASGVTDEGYRFIEDAVKKVGTPMSGMKSKTAVLRQTTVRIRRRPDDRVVDEIHLKLAQVR